MEIVSLRDTLHEMPDLFSSKKLRKISAVCPLLDLPVVL